MRTACSCASLECKLTAQLHAVRTAVFAIVAIQRLRILSQAVLSKYLIQLLETLVHGDPDVQRALNILDRVCPES
jgi:hypothetical protein